jgi:hypothetical protein
MSQSCGRPLCAAQCTQFIQPRACSFSSSTPPSLSLCTCTCERKSKASAQDARAPYCWRAHARAWGMTTAESAGPAASLLFARRPRPLKAATAQALHQAPRRAMVGAGRERSPRNVLLQKKDEASSAPSLSLSRSRARSSFMHTHAHTRIFLSSFSSSRTPTKHCHPISFVCARRWSGRDAPSRQAPRARAHHGLHGRGVARAAQQQEYKTRDGEAMHAHTQCLLSCLRRAP